jgi:hypothetical protein
VLVGQRGPQAPEPVQRLGGTPGAVQGAHELAAERLVQRVLVQVWRQFGDDLGVVAQGQLGLDQDLQRAAAALVQVLAGGGGEGAGGVAERLAAP